MDGLWSSEEMVDILSARPVGTLPETVSDIRSDPYALTAGCAFLALKTAAYDGHDHMTAAGKAAVGLAVVDEDRLVALGHTRLPLLVVRDVDVALDQLAAAGKARSRAKVIAVTGSAGKTMTARMLQAVLSKTGKVYLRTSDSGSGISLALALAGMPADAAFCVIEIPPGEYDPDHMDLLRPDVVVVTNAASAKGKLETVLRPLFSALNKRGSVLINSDDRNHRAMAELAVKCRVKEIAYFGSRRRSDFALGGYEPMPGGQKMTAQIRGERVSVRLPVPGKDMALNAVAALGAAAIAGAEPDAGAAELAGVKPETGRGRIFHPRGNAGTFKLIDESAHATPASMRAGLERLGETRPGEGGSRIAVLGDMEEANKAQHVSLRKLLIEYSLDKVYLAGPQMAHLAEKLDPALAGGHFKDAARLNQALAGKINAGDVVLIKACPAMEFGSIVENMPEPSSGLPEKNNAACPMG